MDSQISIATISRTLGDQLLEIIRLREALAAAQQEAAEARQEVDRLLDEGQQLHDEVDRLRMELERTALDRAVAQARHRPDPSDEPAGDGQVVVA